MLGRRATPPLVLLVDSDPAQTETAAMVADELGCELDVATSGSDALERLGARAPDIVLVDVKTPDVSGWEICRQVKTSPNGADTQVLLVTNREDDDETLPGFDALASDYVARPFLARELRARLRGALRTRELLDALALRTRFSDLEREIDARLCEPGDGSDECRTRSIVPVLDRLSAHFGTEGASIHLRHPSRPETRSYLSSHWPSGMPPSYLAVLALAENPSVERAPRMPGEARDAGAEWIVASAPLWADPELIGTVRLHRLSLASDGHELQHLVFLAARMARALHLAELLEERRAVV